MKNKYISLILATFIAVLFVNCSGTGKIKTLMITGQGSDQLVWMTRSPAVEQILNATGLFSVKTILTPSKGEDMSGFSPSFSGYDLVVIDYEGDAWPAKTEAALEAFVKNGGGVVRIHSLTDGKGPVPPSVTFSKSHDYEVKMSSVDHPVLKGLPVRWLHPADVIVQGLPLAGDNIKILATAVSDVSFSGTGKPEPVMLVSTSGKGRIFWTLLGTPDLNENDALKCAGFIVTLQRGAEWAARGTVTQEVPFDFPTAAGVVLRPDYKAVTIDEAFEKVAGYEITKSTKYITFIQNEIRKASGDEKKLMEIERRIVTVLKKPETTTEAKKLLIRELSWMGTDYSVPKIKALGNIPELKDVVEFALARLEKN